MPQLRMMEARAMLVFVSVGRAIMGSDTVILRLHWSNASSRIFLRMATVLPILERLILA